MITTYDKLKPGDVFMWLDDAMDAPEWCGPCFRTEYGHTYTDGGTGRLSGKSVADVRVRAVSIADIVALIPPEPASETLTLTGTPAERRAQLQAALDALPAVPERRWEGDSIVNADGSTFGYVRGEIASQFWRALHVTARIQMFNTRNEARAWLAEQAGIEP